MGLDAFRDYCERNQYPVADMRENKEHTAFVKRICEDPRLVVPARISKQYTEVGFGERREEITRCDIVFFAEDRTTYIVECKASPNPSRQGRGQLRAAYQFVSTNFGISPLLIAVHPSVGGKIIKESIAPSMGDLFALINRNK